MLVKVDKPLVEGWDAYGSDVWMLRKTINLRFTSIIPTDVTVRYERDNEMLVFTDGDDEEEFEILEGRPPGPSSEDNRIRLVLGRGLDFLLRHSDGTNVRVAVVA